MQLIASPRAVRMPLGAAVLGSVVGVVLLTGGLFLAWLAFATPLVSQLTPSTIRPTVPQMALGGLIWGLALVAPFAFLFAGAWRLSRVFRAVFTRPGERLLTRVAKELGDDYSAASDLLLPEGRLIHNVVIGPFGLAVINELPPNGFVRRTGQSWEIRGQDGRWTHMENPVERAARDAERFKRWFTGIERDFVLKVFAALVVDGATIERSPACAVVTSAELPAWLMSLPPTRIFTPDRRAEVVAEIAELL